VRELAAKLRITAALLGCASQKDLCARFRAVNPQTTFDLERSYKWMQGRAQPRSARLYEDWATLLGTNNPIAHLQSCTVDEFLDLVCERHKVSRDALAARAAVVVATQGRGVEPERGDWLPGRHLVGTYACYSHAWSPHFEGRIIRSALAIDVAADASALPAAYVERGALGRVEVRGRVSVASRTIHVDLADPIEFRLTMCLYQPGTLGSVLAGVMSGASWLDADAQPSATPIVLIRIPGATAATLEGSNRYVDAMEPLSHDLAALGICPENSAELDALLDGVLRADERRDLIKVDAGQARRLTLAIDRLCIDSVLIPRSEAGPLNAAGE
jgi:hypothetical protein